MAKSPSVTARQRLSQKTLNGRLSEDFAIDVVRGLRPAPISVQWECARWLYEREFGKTAEIVLNGELSDSERAEALGLEPEEVSILLKAIRAKDTKAPTAATPQATN